MNANSIENQIAIASEQQRSEGWASRQEAARRQQEEAERNRAERYRTQRISQLKAALESIPSRRNHAENHAKEADELAGILSLQLDRLANDYVLSIHGERQGGRPVRLELGTPEAQAYFFGATIKKQLRQLALTANNRNVGAPLLDAESLANELKEEEKRLKAELAELQLRG